MCAGAFLRFYTVALYIAYDVARRILHKKYRKWKISGTKKIWSRQLSLHIVSFLELVYTAACVNELLLASKERVALIADIHPERFHVFGGTRFERFAAGAYNRNFMILRMYIGLHFIHLALDFNAKLLYIILYGQSINLPP